MSRRYNQLLDLSGTKIIVLAAWRALAASGEISLSDDELTLAAWQAAPIRFGLRSCPMAHPDRKRVVDELCSPSGPVARGWLRRAKEGPHKGRYLLTEAGTEIALGLRRRQSA